jgi:hypothetical protein
MTDDQAERLIVAVERMAAAKEKEVTLARRMQARLQRQMESGEPPPGVRRQMEAMRRERPPAPPEFVRQTEALEKIAALLERRS